MVIKLLTLASAILFVAGVEKARFDNFKVYRVVPHDVNNLDMIKSLESLNAGYNFWTDVTEIGKAVDVMVAPLEQADFEVGLEENGFSYEVIMENVQENIDKQMVRSKSAGFGWTQYHELDEIYNWMYSLEKEFPGVVKVIKGGSTYEGRDILGVHVTFNSENENKGVFIEGGIHAREWISPATVTYMLNQILKSDEPSVRKIATSYDWYIFPSFNPDGYVYTFKQNRMWRKTRSFYGFCRGADPNRNWGYKWRSGGSSNVPCFDTYAGPRAFSEIETRSMSQYISSIGKKLVAYLAFHSYSQLLLIPYGHTAQHLENYDELYEVGIKAASALSKRYGTNYTVGNIPEAIYIATGGSMDWAKKMNDIRITYTYELRDKGKNGFILPPEQIVPTGEETLDSVVTILSEFNGN